MKQQSHNNNEHHHDHDKHAGHSVAMFKDKFWLCLLLTLPVLLYSETIQTWLNLTPPKFTGAAFIPFVFGSIIFFYGGAVFIKGAFGELRAKLPGMMTLISLAIITSYVYSFATLFFIEGEGFFWELASLITIMLLGHWLEMSSVAKAESSLEAISKLLPDRAEKFVNKKPQFVLVSELEMEDEVYVRPGARIPVDGLIVKGESSVDESAITGESRPVNKKAGSKVVAGTLNQDGLLTVKVTKLGEYTALAGIMRLVAEAQASKSNVQILADIAAFYLTIIAILSGAATFGYWLIAKNVSFALERSVTVLIIACPHALGLAIPLVVAISTSLSARNGLLVRNRLALESARQLDWVLFDKTGTLTKGEHVVTEIWPAEGFTQKDILRIAASLEQGSEHIVGKAIVKKAEDSDAAFIEVKAFNALRGAGVRGKLKGEEFTATSFRYVDEKNIEVPKEISSKLKTAAKEGKTEVYLFNKNKIIGAIMLADELRLESKKAIDSLKRMGIKTAMITGDSNEVAMHIANQLNLDQYFAEVKPGDKAEKVKSLQKEGSQVAMVGDGVNDAPALTQANIGIAIGAGTDVAIKSADIILVNNNPEDVIKVIRLSKGTYRKMVQNLGWATGYNVVAIPLAAGILYGNNILLSPAIGAVFMSLSTIVVAFNAQLLRKINLKVENSAVH